MGGGEELRGKTLRLGKRLRGLGIKRSPLNQMWFLGEGEGLMPLVFFPFPF